MRKKRDGNAGSLLAFVLGPLGAVRDFCLECQGGDRQFVESCIDGSCPLFDLRQPSLAREVGHEASLEEQHRALRGIRRQCLACAGSPRDVRSCDAKSLCPLWPHRFGVTQKTYDRVSKRFAAFFSAS